MRIPSLKHISFESLSSDNSDTLRANAPEIIENIIKTKFNLVQYDATKSFADLGCTPDQWHEIIQEINTALSLQLDPETNFLTPADLIASVAAQIAEPIIAKEDFESYIKQTDALLADLETMTDTSTEGLGDLLKRALISTGDVFGKMANSFKTSVFRFYKDTKRSEIRMYYEGNRIKISSVESAPFEKFMNINADTPTGLKGTMCDGVNSVISAYNDLDLFPFMGTAEKYLNDALLSITRETGKLPVTSDVLVNVKNRTTALKKISDSQVKIFTNNKLVKDIAFKTAYKSMEEFKEVREKLLGLQVRIDEANRMNAVLDEMDKTLSDIEACVESDNQISKDFVQGVLEITKYLSAACSFYGENVAYQLALEHNHVLNLQACWMAMK